MNIPKISIIVPVYKVEKYLCRCLDSIQQQTFTDWECILVDDGSPDESGNICDDYSKLDNRFRVFHKENGGVSSARNLGIEKAKGKWFWFVDADDTIDCNMLQKYSDTINTFDYACLFFGYETRLNDGSIEYSPEKTIYSTISNDEALMETCRPKHHPYNGYLWNKLFKRDLIINNSVRFNNNIFYNEDRLFTVEYLCHCKNQQIFYSTDVIYNYYIHKDSAMYKITSKFIYDKHFVTDLDAFIIILNNLKRYGNKEILTEMQKCMMLSYRFIMSCAYNSGKRSIKTRLYIASKMLRGLGIKTWLQLKRL